MISVAIDGPAGAGKSTIAKAAARRLNYIYVDTGALYRAIGLFAAENNISTKDEKTVSENLDKIKIEIAYVDGAQHVFLNGRDVSDEIRQPEMGMAASDVSAMPKVREFLLDLQRNMAKTRDVIMDGRDIATVVLPFADVKIFLTASPGERAARRYKEHVAKGENVSYNEVLESIILRDNNDMNRKIAPLRQAEDAVLLDTTNMTLGDATEKVMEIVKERIK